MRRVVAGLLMLASLLVYGVPGHAGLGPHALRRDGGTVLFVAIRIRSRPGS